MEKISYDNALKVMEQVISDYIETQGKARVSATKSSVYIEVERPVVTISEQQASTIRATLHARLRENFEKQDVSFYVHVEISVPAAYHDLEVTRGNIQLMQNLVTLGDLVRERFQNQEIVLHD